MKKMKMKSKDIVDENIEKIKSIFPNCVIEDKEDNQIHLSIDFETLKQELSKNLVNSQKERYLMTWPGKSESILLANSSTNKTLRPRVEESVDFYNTQNLYIEGNNLEVLKVLRESYLHQIGVIYIDPPYNTGRNILYHNDFSVDKKTFSLINSDVDKEGNVLRMNRNSEGRFHTEWLNRIYPVLRIARDLLTNDGVIFLAIDDNEYANLKKMCDEVFYPDNYIGTIVTRSNPQGRGKKNVDPVHEYHLVYAKNYTLMPELKILKASKDEKKEYWNFIRGGANSRKNERPFRFYPMLVKKDVVSCISKDEYSKIYSVDSGFDEKYMKELENKYTKAGYLVIWPFASNGEAKVWQRKFDRAVQECDTYRYINGQIKYPLNDYSTPKSLWYSDIHSNVQNGTGYLNKLFKGKDVFDFPKSVYTVKDLISSIDAEYIMDFFAGSATTADAVMRLNAENSENRKYIMVQLPENLDENLKFVSASDSTIHNAINLCNELKLPHTIAEVAKERIRRSAKLIQKEYKDAKFDAGFRVLKLDSTCMEDVYYTPDNTTKLKIKDSINNVKSDRSSLDLIFQIMLELGCKLSSSIKRDVIGNKKYYSINNNELICCFDDELNDEFIKKLAALKPNYCVFKDSSFEDDATEINASQIFKNLSPQTILRII